MMRKKKYYGGGANNSSLKNSTSVFKPLIASSLALALGMSVAVATDPTFQTGTTGVDSNNTIQSPSTISVGNISWSAGSNGLLQATNNTDSTIIDTINIVFDKSDTTGSGAVSGSAITITSGGNITSSRQPVLQLTSSQGIMLGNDGSGKLALDFNSASYSISDNTKSRYFILDLSGVTSGTALKGNIELGTGEAAVVEANGKENCFVGKFGGSGMEGNITINKTGDGSGLRSFFTFTGNANLNGNFTLNANGASSQNNTFTFENGDILGKISSKSYGSILITYGQGNKTIASSLDMMAGTLTYKFATAVTNNKTFTLDASKANISGGKVVFDGVSQLIFKNGNAEGGTLTIAPKTDGGTTYQNGSLTINLDSSAQTNQSNPIIKGNISATNGNIAISLKDTSGKTSINPFTNLDAQLSSLDTYYVDGSISITDGGISAFWDDTLGFYGKVSAPITVSGSLIGKSDILFSQAQNIKSIQATNGISHIVFEKSATISGDANNTAIKSGYGRAMILFGANSTIAGNIVSQTLTVNDAVYGNETPNIIVIAKNGLTIGSSESQQLYIYSGGVGVADTRNLIEISGDVTLNGKIGIINDRTMSYDYHDQHQNILKFNGNITGDGIISELSARNGSWDQFPAATVYNVLSFEGKSQTSLTIGDINKTSTLANFHGANNYIGKGFTTGSGDSLTLNSTIFNDDTWKGTDYQANIVLTITGAINSYTGTNYINVAELDAESVIANSTNSRPGTNNIVVGQGNINNLNVTNGTNNVKSLGNLTLGSLSSGGSNNVTILGNGTITGGISAHDGSNTITATTDGTTLTLGSETNKISLIADGGGAAGTNTITAKTINANINEMNAGTSGWSNYKNEIIADAGNISIQSLSTSYFNNSSMNNNTYNSITLKSGDLTIGSISATQGQNRESENQFTLGEIGAVTANITGNLSTSGNGAKILFDVSNAGSSLTFGGNIANSNSGATNITLNSDDIVVTLKGADSDITALTALSGATNGNTLTLDASTNDTVNATINTLTNGDKLNVNFAGIDEIKSTNLSLDTTTNNALKSVSVESGINNTLVVAGTGTMTIGSASIGDAQGAELKAIIFDLTSGSGLDFTSGLVTNAQGIVSFNLGGTNNTITGTLTNSGEDNFNFVNNASLNLATGLTTNANAIANFNLTGTNTIAGTLTNNGIHNFNLASGATTLQYGAEGLAFSRGENNLNFVTGASTLNWKNSGGTALKNISTTGGTTNFNLVDNADATIASTSTITTSGGATNINFGDGTKLTVDSIATSASSTPNTSSTTTLNFNGNGELAGALNTSGGTTNINIAYDKKATIGGVITTSAGATNVFFNAGTSTSRDSGYSILELGGATNAISSVTSDANGVILLNDTNGATIDETTINKSLIFAFEGAGASEVDVSKQGITVGKGATLGISLAGTGTTATKTIKGNIDLQEGGSTLIVDFQANNTADGAIGGGAININDKSFSVINFHAGNKGVLKNGNITVKSGGTNTVNFYGDASLSGVVFESGANSIINVYNGTDGANTTDGIVDISQIGGVKNTITLYDYATLSLESGGTGTLTSSTLGNTLNFKGNGGILKGGFGATGSGSATINVGNVDYGNNLVKGTITGKVDNATLVFNAKYSVLELQSTTNTFKSIDSQAQYGIVALNTANNNVDVNITDKTSIDAEKSLIFSFDGNNDSTVTTNGNLTVAGTLGVIINGDGNKKITGDVDLGGSGTLLVEFASGDGTATLGGVDNSGKAKKISIKNGESSIINFRGTGTASLANAISLDGGTSTINFYRDGTVGGIDLNSGTSVINVEGESSTGYTVKLDGVGEVGNVANIINLGEKANFNVVGTKGGADGSGTLTSSSSAKASELNFVGADATFQGGFGVADNSNGIASINVDATGASITGNVTKSSLAFGSNGGALTLKGTTNTLTTISTTSGNRAVRQGRMARVVSNTLTLDTTAGNNETTVSGVLNAQALTVNLNTTDASHIATLELNGGSLGTINVVGGDQTKNTLALNSNETSVNTFVLATNAGLDIQFNGGGLNAVNGIAKDTNKTFKLSAKTGDSYVRGGVIDANTLDIASGSSLAVRNATATFATVSGSGTLTLDGAGAGANVEVIATSVSGSNITANFNGNAIGGNTLVLSNDTILADITFGANSANNIISVASGKTLTVANTEGVTVGSDNAITFSLANTSTLNLAGGMTSTGNSTISVDSTGSANRATLSGGNINVSNVSLSGNNASTLTLTATSTDIATLTTSATTSNTLIVDGAGSTNGASATLHTINGALDIEMNGANSKVATLTLNGGAINSVSATAGNEAQNIINFKSGTTIITNAIDSSKVASGQGLALNINSGRLILEDVISTDGGGTINVNNNATLQLKGTTASVNGLIENKISSLSGNGVVDLAVADSNGNPLTRSVRARAFKTLTIADYKDGNSTFNVYVNPKAQGSTKADQVNITDTSSSGVATFTVTGNIDEILAITKADNVIVGNIKGNATVAGGDSLIGYDIIQAQVSKESNGDVILGQSISKGVAQEIKDVASSALTVNYDLFLANFNSLNKRMGELRDNANSQGVWARVFGGAMSNDFGAGSKTQYVTAQAGYDYSLTLGDARNYMGIAVAYGHSTTKSNALNIQASQGATIALQDVKSNMVEVGIYNSYVMDSGWYNDTIFKFDYIMSSFTMTDNLSLESETNNFAMILSDEFGYRYKFAENEKGNWYIDPQVEVAFGYFNQSDFNRAMVATNSTLEASQDNILTLRTRAGLSLGKKFITEKGFASLYVGAFYEYDYINGGDAEVLSKSGIANPLDKLESNGRAIVNIGSNIELTEGVRMYIDVEKSFGDKQRVDMQFNFGARYSFGEKVPTLSYQEAQKKRVAPLKVEEKQEVQESKTEASANTEVK